MPALVLFLVSCILCVKKSLVIIMSFAAFFEFYEMKAKLNFPLSHDNDINIHMISITNSNT